MLETRPAEILAAAPIPEPPQWLARRFATRGDICLVTSDGGVGKSTLVLAFGAAVAGGYPLFDRLDFQVQQGPVLYISEEDPAAVILNRLGALIAGHGWDRERVLGNFHFLAMEGTSLDSPEWRAHILEVAKEIGAVLVIFDPYAELTTAKENDNDSAKPLVRYFRKMGQATGAVVVIVHHVGKAVEGKRKLDRIRGASALNAAARMIYFLELCDLGIAVECLKLTKAEKLSPFVVTREVDTSPDNPAEWALARMRYLSQRKAEEATAGSFIRRQLQGGRMNTTQLKQAAQGTGVSGQDVSSALAAMEERGEINYEDGPKNSKLWGLVCLPADSRQPWQPEVASLPTLARQLETPAPVVAPIYREGNHGQGGGQGRHPLDRASGAYERL